MVNKEIKNWINRTTKPQMREAVVSMIYTHCSAEDLKPRPNLMPTTDSNCSTGSTQGAEDLCNLRQSGEDAIGLRYIQGAARVSHCSLYGRGMDDPS